MSYCTQCGGTGKTVNDKYCSCQDGKFKRVLDSANERAKEAMKEEAKKAFEREKNQTPKAKKKETIIDFKPGDWVIIDLPGNKYDKVLCEVTRVVVADNRVFLDSREFKEEMNIKPKHLKHAPIELDSRRAAALRDMYINMAIDTNDHEWLKELGGVRK